MIKLTHGACLRSTKTQIGPKNVNFLGRWYKTLPMINTFGHLFKFTSFGESHGKAIGCIVDGVPSGLSLTKAQIQPALDKRKPGQSKYTTQRQEADQVEILSGTFDGYTTGTPIALLIHNTDQRSKDYGEIKDQFRPGHADFTYWAKYGVRDFRGGGRSSARETAVRVAAGAVAQVILAAELPDLTIHAGLVQMGPFFAKERDWDQVSKNPFYCPDAKSAEQFAIELDKARKSGNSYGAAIEICVTGMCAGLGQPLYGKLDQDLTAALMSINAVKGVEIGEGMAAAALTGSENADEMSLSPDGSPIFSTNHAGGVLGGISSGQDLIARFAVKPTSSILTPRQSLDRFGQQVSVLTKGRHDPCVGIRAVPVAIAMTACVIADHVLLAKADGTPLKSLRPWASL